MDRAEWVHRRKARYMAQILEGFEREIEPHLNGCDPGAVQDFKGLVRARLNALATDANDLMKLGDRAMEQNQLGQELRDGLHPTGRP